MIERIRIKKIGRKLIVAGLIAVVLAGLLAAGLWWRTGRSSPSGQRATFYEVQQGDLTIAVTQSGSIKALDPVTIKSQVEGQVTIISLIPEGTELTEEDVQAGKVLVELDSSDIDEQMMQQQITYANAEASYIEAKESYAIQVKQNESDLNASLLKLKFALMDLRKYLGEDKANELIESLDIDGHTKQTISVLSDDPNQLGGESLQKYRELDSKIILVQEELGRAESRLIWTRRLVEKEYAAKSDEEADEFKVKSLDVDLKKAQMALELFLRYEFPKETEKLLSDYQEAQRELQRTEAKTRSQLAQANAKLQSNEATFKLQQDRLARLQKQKDACVIKAPAAGMVVYTMPGGRWNPQPMEAGTMVRERQEILSITNMSAMGVEIKIHEVSVHKVKPGQPARITMDAYTDQMYSGNVLKVAQLPDQQNFFLNPDLKVYAGEVSLENCPSFLKPGMSAKVEIIVEELRDVVYVPIQAVVNRSGKKVAFVQQSDSQEMRQVQTGAFNDSYIQITHGLNKGEKVSLNPPRLFETGQPDEPQKPQKEPQPDDDVAASAP